MQNLAKPISGQEHNKKRTDSHLQFLQVKRSIDSSFKTQVYTLTTLKIWD